MLRTLTEKFLREIHLLTHFLQKRLKEGRNLVYYASGTRIRDAYFDLPFDYVVLVDYNFRHTFTMKGNIISIGLTALEATAVFQEAGIQFDALVCINEGLSEGGGSYPINGNWSMGTILPILKDEYLHIACPSYYGQRRWKKMFNLPQQVVLLSDTDDRYLDPGIFSEYHRYGEKASVWLVRKQPGPSATFKAGTRNITIQRKNIWEDYDELDSLFVRCSPYEARNLQRVAPKATILMRDYSIEQILRFCTIYKIENLGLTPWRRGQYDNFIDFLIANEEQYPYPRLVAFYHLHQNDFQQLYVRALR